LQTFLLYVGFGLVTAAILALSAVSFTMQYAVSRVANLAHGELLTIGAYVAYSVEKATHNVPLSAAAAAGAGALAALFTNFAVVERFAQRPAIVTLIATLGLSLVLQNVLVMIYGGANVAYTINQGAPHKIGPFLWTNAEITVMVAALAVAAALYVLLQRTKFGKSIRAVAENRDLARVSGIRAGRVITQTWLIAGMVAGFAGFVLAETVGTFSPGFGFSFLLITITAAVAGGLGRPYGTLVGALLVGLILELAGAYSNASYELAFAFGVLVLLLLFRPNGIFVGGRRAAVA
jgi:branched-subunit amino acid ABC-type transport system permease component